jgi:hypothetical protein
MVEFRCAFAASERGEPLFATASQVRRWLLIEVRGAWGRHAVADTDLARYATVTWRRRLRDARIRVIVIRRDLDRSANRALETFYIDSGQLTNRGRGWRHAAATLHAAVDATSALPTAGENGWQPHPDPLVLVCTNGRHDACCATYGRPLVRALRESARNDMVWECSHVGGDRFAGNLVILPEGLYFGRCDAEAATSVLDAYQRGEIELDHYRGRSVLGFHEQAVDYFVRRELGLTAIDAIAAIRRVDGSSEAFTVDVTTDGSTQTVHATVARGETTAPTALTCTGPVGQLVPSYRLVSIRETEPPTGAR